MSETQESFLKPSVNQIRKSIRDIDDSYNHDWDVLAELCQNSVDAIREADNEKGKIILEIDSIEKEIKIEDNGIGIDPDRLPDLLKPFATDKDSSSLTVGEKGVGLTFVMFSGNYFEIKSGTEKGASKGIVKDAAIWKNRTDELPLPLDYKKIDDDFKGTEVVIREIEDEKFPLFNLNFKQLKHVLRTKTALGSTKSLFDIEDQAIDIKVIFKDKDNQTHEEEIPFKYWMPNEGLKDDTISIEEFHRWRDTEDRTDSEKRQKISQKIIEHSGEFEKSDNRKIRYKAVFVPERKTWNKLNINYGLATEKKLDNEDWRNQFNYVLFNNGIFSSVRGMPTGIRTNQPDTGWAGYWSNVFMIFEDSNLSFDIGRKSLFGGQVHMIKKHAKDVFNEFIDFVPKYSSGPIPTGPDFIREDIFSEIESKVDIEFKNVSWKKSPRNQEASVAGIFFEIIGNGTIEGIEPLSAGYNSTYDLYAKWKGRPIVIEFKSNLRNIVDDFASKKKLFNHIDCLVCWEITEKDESKIEGEGLSLNKINESVLGNEMEQMPGTTHLMTLSGMVDPIYVIDLKTLLIENQ
ncbi:ATPase/histidine kinase/DNA gyrase B/HSP90 superfamily protein [Methanonatronarchaeum thermophilum]|uniref:ATPase/histidine kinase/DNA gyrase B/HSP90 superfamily protein n=1 Tax=Methanonatronarchaeum thermophilum TaxID=1927129 RepID=A0A1Y3GBG2_9EURY|nr:ATP-binding protein [Methanonatronarchaeum thermophilum]OUJ18768.1 ATPase/histidine kinase/DNA gyrase B/HSP90 superfamily protein [Methanonatronarchaeum thermophilum]